MSPKTSINPSCKQTSFFPLQMENERREAAERAGQALAEREAARTGLKAAEKELRALGEQRKAAQARYDLTKTFLSTKNLRVSSRVRATARNTAP